MPNSPAQSRFVRWQTPKPLNASAKSRMAKAKSHVTQPKCSRVFVRCLATKSECLDALVKCVAAKAFGLGPFVRSVSAKVKFPNALARSLAAKPNSLGAFARSLASKVNCLDSFMKCLKTNVKGRVRPANRGEQVMRSSEEQILRIWKGKAPAVHRLRRIAPFPFATSWQNPCYRAASLVDMQPGQLLE